MIHVLFIEIDKFDKWAQGLSEIPQDDRGGEWECDYRDWDAIYEAFGDFIIKGDRLKWTKNQKQRLLYIIARDNEMERLSEILPTNEKALVCLSEESIANGQTDDKWQLAVQLHKLTDRDLAINLLEQLINAEEEYVNRRALVELAKLRAGKVEFYCEQFWNRHKYDDMEEYQRMAVLQALTEIKSKQLDHYLELAMKDGRKYLVKMAKDLIK